MKEFLWEQLNFDNDHLRMTRQKLWWLRTHARLRRTLYRVLLIMISVSLVLRILMSMAA